MCPSNSKQTDAQTSLSQEIFQKLWGQDPVATRGGTLVTATQDAAHVGRLVDLLQPRRVIVFELDAASELDDPFAQKCRTGMGQNSKVGLNVAPDFEIVSHTLAGVAREQWVSSLEKQGALGTKASGVGSPWVYDQTDGAPALRLALMACAREGDGWLVLDGSAPHETAHLRWVGGAAPAGVKKAAPLVPATPAIGLPSCIRTAATHDRMFHADDVLGGALLRMHAPEVTFVRTRDPQKWAQTDVVFDVGGDYAAGKDKRSGESSGENESDESASPWVFDHHQRVGPNRNDGKPFASFGLLWRELGAVVGAKVLAGVAAPLRDEVLAAFEADFVRSVDDHDNTGKSEHSGAQNAIRAIGMHGPVGPPSEDTTPQAFDAAYEQAVGFGIQVIRRRLFKLLVRIETVPKIEAAIADAFAAKADHLVFDFNSGGAGLWQSVVHAADPEGVLRWVTFDRGNGWIVRNIKTACGEESFLPEAWRGLENDAADAATGIPGTVFVHRSGFLAVHDTLEGAKAMIEASERLRKQG